MKHLKIGDSAPEFVGIDEQGNTVQMSDFKEKKLAIYFYPKDNTPGCTVQACNLRDNYQTLQQNNVSIIGISADNESSHTKFKTKFSLPFPLIADGDQKIINQFGVWGPKKFMGKEYDGIHRTTFVIDENGMIEDVISDVKTKVHASQILK